LRVWDGLAEITSRVNYGIDHRKMSGLLSRTSGGW
jgi:hypothetical protein